MTSRDVILREIGLTPIWRTRSVAAAADEAPASQSAPPTAAPPAPQVAARRQTQTPPLPTPGQVATPPGNDPARAAAIAAMSWDELQQSIAECTACKLCQTRTRTVPGVGDRHPVWMVVGEAPGQEEDKRGEPFVGKAGQLLDAMLAAVDKQRGEGVYIANVIKCRPPGNRNPEPDELAACVPYLKRQIALAQPKLLLALGKFSGQTLLNQDDTVAAMRTSGGSWQGIPVIVTYHPAYLLRSPTDKAKAWEDLLKATSLSA